MLYNFLKTSKQAFGVVLSILLLFMLISCENLFEHISESTENQNGKTYLSINVSKKEKGRTIYPAPIELSALQNLNLKGTAEGDSTPTLNKSFQTYQEITENPELEIAPGKWTLTLSAEYTNNSVTPSSTIQYLATVTTTIQKGKSNPVYFVLTPQSDANGGMAITFDLGSSTGIDKVHAVLSTHSGTEIEEKYIPIESGSNGSISYSKTDLEPGTYHLLFEFLLNKDENNYQQPVNQWESYVYITPGDTTIATIALATGLNTVYTIQYNDATGSEITNFSSGAAITKYSTRSSFTLPTAKQNGKVFLGWQKSGTTESITEITPGMGENLTLVAAFFDPILHVSNSGNDENNGFDSSVPLKTVTGACNQIIKYGYSDLEWTIKISEETTGIPKGTSGKNKDYGHIELPAELTADFAKSILITGATPHSDWINSTVPDDLDSINRGAVSSTSSSLSSGSTISGSALLINTEVPVTISNLKITGGYSSGNGGAINIKEGATVSLGDGVLITGNRASKGGAIFNQGTLYVYGTAVIGDKDSTTFANYDSSSIQNGTSANYASSGGGIYNGDTADTIAKTKIIAHLYLGYKLSGDGTPEVSEWTGGIYYNGASDGGAILNARKSYVYMNSGTIKNNDVSGDGGGIKNIAGRVEMSGGQIIHNRAHYNSSIVRGGGICNEYTQSVFVMSGGTINENVAWARNGTHGKGGGIYNGGKMFMYGSAVIGDKDATSQPWFTQGTANDGSEDTGSYGNRANIGGGIYNANETDNAANLYLGYQPTESDSPDEVNLSGGIYYNYCKHTYSQGSSTWGGGGIYNYSSGKFLMSSGTIAYNATGDDGGGIWMFSSTIAGGDGKVVSIHDNTAEGKGNAIYVYSNQQYNLTISGNIDIPFADGNPHDIYLAGKGSNYSKILIAGDLTGSLSALITPEAYDTTHQLIQLAPGSTANLEAETQCFSVTPQTKDDAGETLTVPVNWEIDSNGKLVKETNGNGNGGNSTPDGITYVDLGLPSGTLWANMNVGATSETDVGSQFQWMDGGVDITQLEYGDIMPAENDIASLNWNEDWIMPTKAQFEELYQYCYFEPVTSYNETGVSGYIVFKAKDESHTQLVRMAYALYDINSYKKDGYDINTDPHIFIPADSDDVYLWTSTYYGDSYGGRDQNAYCFFLVDQYEDVLESEIIKTTTCEAEDWERHPIRPVSVRTGGFVYVEGASIETPPTQFYDGGAFTSASETEPIVVPSFYMCDHEVTQAEYEKYCFYGGTAPSETTNKYKYPAYNISWYDAIVYCNLRSIAEHLTPVYSVRKSGDTTEKSTNPAEWDGIRTQGSGSNIKYCGPDETNYAWDWVADYPGYESIDVNPTANGYRLPSNAEWEYAAREGNGLSRPQTKFSGSATYTDIGYDDFNIHMIKQKQANYLGIYDMSSSVAEWFFDVYGEDYRGISPNTYQDAIDYSNGIEPYERSKNQDIKQGLRVIHY